MLECDAKEKNIYFFIDGKFVTICLNWISFIVLVFNSVGV
jgi:hypothetical protein